MRIAIVTVPYIENEHHLKLAIESLDSITSEEHDIIDIGVVNKWTDDTSNILSEYYNIVIENDVNCLARAWNLGIAEASRHKVDYILIPNLDIIASPNTLDWLVKFAIEHDDAVLWTASETKNMEAIDNEVNNGFAESPHFSFFMVNNTLFDRLSEFEKGTSEPYPGMFDENIRPAYHEDGDMHRRIKLAGLKAYRTGSAMFYHYGSQTIKSSNDPFRSEAMLGSGRTAGYYIQKWGGTPGNEIYLKPFNKA